MVLATLQETEAVLRDDRKLRWAFAHSGRYSLAVVVDVDQLHRGRRSDGSQAIAGDTAGGGGDGLGASHQVGGGITSLIELLADEFSLKHSPQC